MQSVEIKEAPTGPIAPEADKAAGGGDRPVWLDAKFKSPEDMAKAYSELEKKLGGKPGEAPKPEQKADGSSQEQAEAAVSKAGLNLDELSTYYTEHGELSADHYSALAEKAGIPKHFVDAFIEGQKALQDQARSRVFNEVGGEEKYGAMVQWAASSLSKEEVAAYNHATSSGDMEQVMLAVNGLKAKYERANGSEASFLSGVPNATTNAYRSWAEVTRDMNDPRYASDPAFRADVERKVAATRKLS